MNVALMQPYFLPYIGYFQLMNAVDVFYVHDNVEFSKGGWINRNRFLLEGEARTVTVPLKGASDYALISERRLADSYSPHKEMRKMSAAYAKAPFWPRVEETIQQILDHRDQSLVGFNVSALRAICDLMSLPAEIKLLSEIPFASSSRGQQKVLEFCEMVGADEYTNPIGGTGLYQAKAFADRGLSLKFLSSKLTPYPQGGHEFVPALSIVDALSWMGPHATREMVLHDYEFVLA